MSTKKKRILFVVGIIILVCCVFAGSYAYWQVTKEQTDFNLINSGCFDIAYQSEGEKINLENVYPITNEEGNELTPYTFTIQNNCTIDAGYVVYFDVLETSSMQNSSIRTSLNGTDITILSDYETGVTTEEGYKESYKLTTGTLSKSSAKDGTDGESKTYELRIWIDENAPISEASKTFSGKVRIEASPTEITSDEFVIPDPTGELIFSIDISDKYDCDKSSCTPVEDISNVTLSWYDDNSLYFTGTGKVEKSREYYNIPDGESKYLFLLIKEKYKNNALIAANTNNYYDFYEVITENIESGLDKYVELKNSEITGEDFAMYILSEGTIPSYTEGMAYLEENGLTFDEAFAQSPWINVTEVTFPEWVELLREIYELLEQGQNLTNIYISEGITEIPEIEYINYFGDKPANIYFPKTFSYLGTVSYIKANLIFPTNIDEDYAEKENLSLTISNNYNFSHFTGSLILPNYHNVNVVNSLFSFRSFCNRSFYNSELTKISIPENVANSTIDLEAILTGLGQNNPNYAHGGDLSNTEIEFRGRVDFECVPSGYNNYLCSAGNVPNVGTKETNPTLTFLKSPYLSNSNEDVIKELYNNNVSSFY